MADNLDAAPVQSKALAFIKAYRDEHGGNSPSLSRIAKHLWGQPSWTGNASSVVAKLAMRGLVYRDDDDNLRITENA